MKRPLTKERESRKVSRVMDLVVSWFGRHARDLPWRRTRDAYAVWVSEIMLQQTQVKTVIPYWERWLRELPDIKSLARAKPGKLHKLWEGLGYYSRVRNMQKAAQLIIERHQGQFPADYEAMLALPGIGRYTAGAIASIAFHQPHAILDGNVIRVLTRLFGIAGNPREKIIQGRLWDLAGQMVRTAATSSARRRSPGPGLAQNGETSPACSQLNQGLMELGALVCTPRNPQCGLCPVAKHCRALELDQVERLPALAPRAPAIPRHFVALVAERQGRFLVRQRPAGAVNAHFWEFPNVEVTELAKDEIDGVDASHDPRRVGLIREQDLVAACEYLGTIRHSITRYRIRLDVFRTSARSSRSGIGSWRNLRELERLPLTSAHKKILGRLVEAARRGS